MHSSCTDLARCECAFTRNLRAVYAQFTRGLRALHARFTRASRALHARFTRASRALHAHFARMFMRIRCSKFSAHFAHRQSRKRQTQLCSAQGEPMNHLLGPEASRCASCLSVEHQVSAAPPLRPALSPERDATSAMGPHDAIR